MPVKTLALAGDDVPAIGLGTWHMGENPATAAAEANALRAGLEGLRVIDAAEMYAEGGAETVVGQALRGRRADAVVVSKVYPHNASRTGVVSACEHSLRRLGIDRIDVYLLHWRGSHPFAATVAGFEELLAAGKIGAWGVSNLDTEDLAELRAVPGGDACATNQILYNLTRRGPEAELLVAMAAAGMPAMAYPPSSRAGCCAPGRASTRCAPWATGTTPPRPRSPWPGPSAAATCWPSPNRPTQNGPARTQRHWI